MVTREEIAARIWGKDAHLDLDNSINGAVRKIRQALKDDPEQPRHAHQHQRCFDHRVIPEHVDPRHQHGSQHGRTLRRDEERRRHFREA